VRGKEQNLTNAQCELLLNDPGMTSFSSSSTVTAPPPQYIAVKSFIHQTVDKLIVQPIIARPVLETMVKVREDLYQLLSLGLGAEDIFQIIWKSFITWFVTRGDFKAISPLVEKAVFQERCLRSKLHDLESCVVSILTFLGEVVLATHKVGC